MSLRYGTYEQKKGTKESDRDDARSGNSFV